MATRSSLPRAARQLGVVPRSPDGGQRFWRLLAPAVTVGAVAMLVGLSMVGIRIPNPPAIMVLVIVVAAFMGGLGPGLASAVISWLYIALFFSVPEQPFRYTDENLARVAVWAVSMPAMAAVVGALRVRANALAYTLATRERDVARESTEDLRAIVEAAPVAISALDLDGRVRFWSPGAERIYGWTSDEVVGRELPFVPKDRLAEFRSWLVEVRSGNALANLPTERVRKDGRRIEVSVSMGPTRDADDRVAGVMMLGIDETERRQLELQLGQAARMEAVGQLAGGIAHDFNNLLTALGGNAEFLRDDLDADDPRRRQAEEIVDGTRRASALTQQLLAFSRRQILQPVPLRLSDVITGLEPLLRRLITEDIELTINVEPDLGTVVADRTQIEQVLLNLAINARDAMPNGGSLAVEARNIDLDAGYADMHIDVTAGPHVVLSVSDTGIGMDAATRQRIFEPFFTTKAVGQGTGLGLATVYGIVKQSGGHIWVYSEPQQGSSFKVILPRSEAAVAETAPVEPSKPTKGGRETILLVEDDSAVRSYMTAALGRYGYTVVGTGSGDEALEAANGQSFDLVISDIVMPGMSASELATRLREKSPRLRILYMSGYTEDTIVHRGVLDSGVAFLGKPFSAEALAQKVRETLESP